MSDIGNGINYIKKGLNEMIDLVLSHKVDKVVVWYKERLLRFGYELLDNLFSKFGTVIEVVDSSEKQKIKNWWKI